MAESCRAYEKSCTKGHCLEVSHVTSLRFAWQAWHSGTYGRATDARPWWQKVAVPIGKVAKDYMFLAFFIRIALAGLPSAQA